VRRRVADLIKGATGEAAFAQAECGREPKDGARGGEQYGKDRRGGAIPSEQSTGLVGLDEP